MSWASPYRTPLPGPLNRDPSSLALLCTGTPSPSHAPLLVTSGAQDQRLIQSCSLEDPLLLVTSSGQDWGPIQTHSLQNSLVLTCGGWLLKHVWWVSRQYTHNCSSLALLSILFFHVEHFFYYFCSKVFSHALLSIHFFNWLVHSTSLSTFLSYLHICWTVIPSNRALSQTAEEALCATRVLN